MQILYKSLFSLLVVMITIPAMSQSDFRQGFIIIQAGDTIEGLINNKGTFKNLLVCEFKEGPNSPVKEFGPDEIHSFRIYDKGFYESIDIEIDGAKESVFLEKLVEGKVDVYRYSKINDSYFILRTEDGILYDLKNSTIEITNENGTFTKQKKEYVYTLRYLFKDSPTVVNKVNKLPYESKAIIDIAKEYHEDVCDEYECLVYTKTKQSMSLNFGIHIGYSLSNISFESDYVDKMNQDFSSSNDIFFGFYLNLMDPYISERFSLQLDLLYQNGIYIFESTSFDMTYLKVPFSLKYTYPVKKIKPEIQLGIAFNKWLKHQAENIIPEQVVGDALQKRTHQYGFILRAGANIELNEKLGLLFFGSYEYFAGKPWNTYSVPDGNGLYFTLQESVKTKTNFLSASIGLQF